MNIFIIITPKLLSFSLLVTYNVCCSPNRLQEFVRRIEEDLNFINIFCCCIVLDSHLTYDLNPGPGLWEVKKMLVSPTSPVET